MLRQLQTKKPARHFLIAIRQLALLGLLPMLIIYLKDYPAAAVLAGLLLGVVIFSFSVLLHEVIHKTVFPLPSQYKMLQKALGYLYGAISGMSYSQFSRWHLDHHIHLGSETKDPKRHRLSPKKNRRWLKLLYGTPALFFMYFAAVKKTLAEYPEGLRKQILRERRLVMLLHLGLLAGPLYYDAGLAFLLYVVPIFFGFPLAFFVNRMGQHYVIDPEDPARHSTLMRSNGLWDVLFLYSTYHLEHHYYPGVPFYNLRKLHLQLADFYTHKGMKAYSYSQLFHLWIVKNHFPHSNPAPKARVSA